MGDRFKNCCGIANDRELVAVAQIETTALPEIGVYVIHDNCHYQECDFSAITSGPADRVAGTPLKTGRCSTFIGDAARAPCPESRCVRDGMLPTYSRLPAHHELCEAGTVDRQSTFREQSSQRQLQQSTVRALSVDVAAMRMKSVDRQRTCAAEHGRWMRRS